MRLEEDMYKNKYYLTNASFGIIGMQSNIISTLLIGFNK